MVNYLLRHPLETISINTMVLHATWLFQPVYDVRIRTEPCQHPESINPWGGLERSIAKLSKNKPSPVPFPLKIEGAKLPTVDETWQNL